MLVLVAGDYDYFTSINFDLFVNHMNFYETLAKAKNKCRWTCGTKTDGRIRGRIRSGPFKGTLISPIQAADWIKHDQLTLGYVGKFEFCDVNTSYIIYASNYKVGRFNGVAHRDIRNKILVTLGFAEEPNG